MNQLSKRNFEHGRNLGHSLKKYPIASYPMPIVQPVTDSIPDHPTDQLLYQHTQCINEQSSIISSLEQRLHDLEKQIEQLAKHSNDATEFTNSLLARFPDLSSQECLICCYIRKGYHTKEIAAQLNRSEKTIDSHRYNIRRKMKLSAELSLNVYLNRLINFYDSI